MWCDVIWYESMFFTAKRKVTSNLQLFALQRNTFTIYKHQVRRLKKRRKLLKVSFKLNRSQNLTTGWYCNQIRQIKCKIGDVIFSLQSFISEINHNKMKTKPKSKTKRTIQFRKWLQKMYHSYAHTTFPFKVYVENVYSKFDVVSQMFQNSNYFIWIRTTSNVNRMTMHSFS